MKNEIFIVLPEKIFMLRERQNQDIRIDSEEYSLYYKNIIYPYKDEYDIEVECQYGYNLGHCWRIDKYPNDVNEFDFTIKIYGDFGKLLAEKTCKMVIQDKKYVEGNLLCIGDSMTRSEVYVQQAVNKAKNIKTIGLRNIARGVNHEGRGGWTSYAYLESFAETGSGVSPFLFPKGYSGEEYFGDREFWNRIDSPEFSNKYSYSGIKPQKIKEGMVCLDDGVLCRYSNGEYIELEKNPQFEFNFKKYMERFQFEKPDVVSLLFGANEFQTCSYENLEAEIEKYIDTIKKIVKSIKEFDEEIRIVINLPVCGGEQYSWGLALGCKGSSKRYNYCIKMASNALIETFDKRYDENIYICSMLAVCDTDSGFPKETKKCNIYSDATETRCSNWVHPSEVGYKQMGDALAAVIISMFS